VALAALGRTFGFRRPPDRRNWRQTLPFKASRLGDN
jgi:hypothetical protein